MKKFKKVTSIKQAMQDERVYNIERVDDAEGIECYIWLDTDNYHFDDGSGMQVAENAKEVCRIINTEIVEGAIED